MESALKTGDWLVLAFAVWSQPDRNAIRTALDTVKDFEGKINLGIRPLEDPTKHRWCPELQWNGTSPVWLLLKEGELIGQVDGEHPKEELVDIINRHFPDIA